MTAGLAAMQLWGEYNVVSFGSTLSLDDSERFTSMRPTVLAMYAPTRDEILKFWSSIQGVAPSPIPVCTEVPYLGIGSPTASICVTRMQ